MTDREMKELVASIDKLSSDIRADVAKSSHERQNASSERVWENFESTVDELKNLSIEDFARVMDEVLDGLRNLSFETAGKNFDRSLDEVSRLLGSDAVKAERLTSRAALEVKRVSVAKDLRPGRFTGYGARFDESHPTASNFLPPDWNDVIARGAFRRTLAEHESRGTMPALVLHHALASPVGAWRDVREDSIGLFVEGEIATKTAAGRDTFELVKLDALDGLSIGYVVRRESRDQQSRTRTILDVDLLEISLVSVPAIPDARITGVASQT